MKGYDKFSMMDRSLEGKGSDLDQNKGLNDLAEKQADILSVFSNTNRILILQLLDGNEMSVNDIANGIGASVQNTSQHLRLMKAKNILASRRDGQSIYYHLSDSKLGRYCALIIDEYQENFPT